MQPNVIASEAKQSIAPHAWMDGLLRRFAPRNDEFYCEWRMKWT
jgi:hypothetical protein